MLGHIAINKEWAILKLFRYLNSLYMGDMHLPYQQVQKDDLLIKIQMYMCTKWVLKIYIKMVIKFKSSKVRVSEVVVLYHY